MKWVVIAAVVALVLYGGYYVLSHGGALEMQPEHAEAQAPAK